jgi:deoxyadenosine/deoxycytidine kinase
MPSDPVPEENLDRFYAVEVDYEASQLSMLRGIKIGVDGNIALGKSVLVNSLCKFLEVKGIPFVKLSESVDHYMLSKFNQDPVKYALVFQEAMMNGRIRNAMQAEDAANEGKCVIMDTCIMREIAFTYGNYAAGNMTEQDVNKHMKSFRRLHASIGSPVPDIILCLDAPADKSKWGILARKRGNEHLLRIDYLNCIRNAYKDAESHDMLQSVKTFFTVDVSNGFASQAVFSDILGSLKGG